MKIYERIKNSGFLYYIIEDEHHGYSKGMNSLLDYETLPTLIELDYLNSFLDELQLIWNGDLLDYMKLYPEEII